MDLNGKGFVPDGFKSIKINRKKPTKQRKGKNDNIILCYMVRAVKGINKFCAAYLCPLWEKAKHKKENNSQASGNEPINTPVNDIHTFHVPTLLSRQEREQLYQQITKASSYSTSPDSFHLVPTNNPPTLYVGTKIRLPFRNRL